MKKKEDEAYEFTFNKINIINPEFAARETLSSAFP